MPHVPTQSQDVVPIENPSNLKANDHSSNAIVSGQSVPLNVKDNSLDTIKNTYNQVHTNVSHEQDPIMSAD